MDFDYVFPLSDISARAPAYHAITSGCCGSGFSLASQSLANINFYGGNAMKYRIIKENKRYIFEILVPCIRRDDLAVSVDKNSISVNRAEHEQDSSEVYKSYDFDLNDKASLKIPIKEYDLKWKDSESRYENGVLTIVIPRMNPAISLLLR